MALSFTVLTNGTSNTLSGTSASISPTYTPVIVFLAVAGSSPPAGSSVSGCGLTWTNIGQTTYSTRRVFSVWRGTGTPTSGTLSLSAVGSGSMGMAWAVLESPDIDSLGTVETNTGSGTTASDTIGTGSPASGDASLSGATFETDTGGTWEAGWAELTDQGVQNVRHLTTAWSSAHDSTPSVTFGASDGWGMLSLYVFAAASGVDPLTAGAGSFTLTGQAASALVTRLLASDQGGATLSGQTTNLLAGRTLVAAHGSFATTEQAASLIPGRALAAAAASFTLSGQTTNLLAGRALIAAHGSFATTEQAANLIPGRALAAAAASFTLSGQTANLLASLSLSAASGSGAITGQVTALTSGRYINAGWYYPNIIRVDWYQRDVYFSAARTFSGDSGSFVLSGGDATMSRGWKISLDAGTFALTGVATTLRALVSLTSAVGSLTIDSTNVSLLGARIAVVDVAALDTLGKEASLLASWGLTAEGGALVADGQPAGLSYTPLGTYELTAEPAAISLAGQAANVILSRLAAAAVGAVSLTGQAATLSYTPLGAYSLTAETITISLTGQAAAVLATRVALASAASFTLAGQTANVFSSRLTAAAVGAVSLTGQAASALVAWQLAGEAGALAAEGQPAGLSYTQLGAYSIQLEPIAFFLASSDAGVTTAFLVPGDVASVTLSGTDSGLAFGGALLQAEGGIRSLSGPGTTLTWAPQAFAAQGSFSFTGEPAGALWGAAVFTESGAVSVQGFDISYTSLGLLTTSSGALTLTGESLWLHYSNSPPPGATRLVFVVESDRAFVVEDADRTLLVPASNRIYSEEE